MSFVVWLTGLSGSGKTTISIALEKELEKNFIDLFLLDGDIVRQGLCSDLGFSNSDREENIRRISEVTKLFYLSGQNVCCSFISPFEKEREFAKNLVDENNFIEVFVNCPIDICEKRDVKGMYKKARDGEIKEFTGISSPYENPINPSLEIKTDLLSVEDSVSLIIDELKKRDLI